jgi:SAM-dependent methyltransferase
MKDACSTGLKPLAAWLAGGALTLWILAGSCTASDVPYVPTPQHTVVEMLTMASVGEGDLVYDLGSGDGRFVITAAEMGASGVGIDIDPQRIREANENAAAAGVADRVVFYQQDLFDAYIEDATVVTLYLLPSINLKLRPKLLEELRPGARIVSYSFDMGAWQPDQQLDNERAYLWIVPANLTGIWRWSGSDGDYEMAVDQHFQQITGSISNGPAMQPISSATLTGDLVEIVVEQEMGGVMETVIYQGRVDGETIEGVEESAGGGAAPWRARRDPGTATSLDDGSDLGFTRLLTPARQKNVIQ